MLQDSFKKLLYLVKLYVLDCILYYSLEFLIAFHIAGHNKLFSHSFFFSFSQFLYYLPFSIFHAHSTHIHACTHNSFPSIFACRSVFRIAANHRANALFSNRFRKPIRRVIVLLFCVNCRQILYWFRMIPRRKTIRSFWSAAGENSRNEFASRSWRTVIRHFHLHYEIV